MLIIFLILLAFAAPRFAHAQVPNLGPCPSNVKTVHNFDAQRYLGRWYEYAKYPFIFESNGKCIYAEYGLQPNGDVSVYNYNIDKITGKQADIKGSAKIVGDGKLAVKFDSMPAFLGPADYWVLGTDYNDYTVVYSCSNFGIFHTKVVWILTRQRMPATETILIAKEIIKEQQLSLAPLMKTDQQNCPK